MFTQPTLMAAREGKSGPFVKWLEQLGLGDFLKRYPLPKLVEWGWVVPQYRLPFPRHFFDAWENFPCIPWEPPANLDDYSTLWNYSWGIDADTEPLWFLDPILHPGNGPGELLRQHAYVQDVSQIPPTFTHARGIPITPYVDYFYRWQGYALVDIVFNANSIEPIYSTPDIMERALGLVGIAERISTTRPAWPRGILTAPKRWGGLSALMTQLDHFTGLQNAISYDYESDFDKKQELYRKGGRALAEYFHLTPESLADSIKEHLLALAQEWMESNARLTRRSIWTLRAWPHLQADIETAMTWLIQLTGKSFEDYVDEWRRPYLGRWEWAKLDAVLPYAFIQHKKKFLEFSPIYLEEFNQVKNCPLKWDETTLPSIIRNISQRNYPFEGFLAAFHELHEQLSYRDFDKGGIDFRSLRPLDHYALLAIHAEGCLRRELDRLGLLSEIDPDSQGLSRYIQRLIEAKGLPDKLLGSFNSQHSLADLRTDRNDPIGRIKALRTKLSAGNHQLVQGFLCCLLARNYFAHHDFLDHELVRSEKSAFMLKGILLTVLVLLNA